MRDEHTSYRERTPWPGWVNALFGGAVVVSCYPLLAGWDTELPFAQRLLIVIGILSFAGLASILMSGMTVLVQQERVLVHMGRVQVVRKIVPYERIESLESVRYRPIREFGGWGIRGWGSKKAWTARGDQAVVLALRDGTALYLGSDNPRRLEERIRAVAGSRIGGG